MGLSCWLNRDQAQGLAAFAVLLACIFGWAFAAHHNDGAAPTRSIPPYRMLEPAEIEALFERPTTVLTIDGEFTLSVRRAGDLRLPSGRVEASDAFFPEDPFTRTFAPGTYPVDLLIADMKNGDRRVAAAMIRTSVSAPATWEMAVQPGQDPRSLASGQFFMAARMKADIKWTDDIIKIHPNDYPWIVDYSFGDPAGPNLIAFSSGYGDGGYPSFFGLDSAGRTGALLTDFDILAVPPSTPSIVPPAT